MRLIASLRANSRGPLLQVVKTSVAAILAWLASALLLEQPLPIFAAIAALLVVQPSVNQSIAKGIERSAGVIAGVLLAYLAGIVFGHSSWVVLAIIVVALLLAWALKLSPGSSNQIPISAMLVLAIGSVTPGYAVNRIIETVIGAAVGLGINALIVPPVLTGPAHTALADVAQGLARTFRSLASVLREPADTAALERVLVDARQLRPLRQRASDALDRAEDSLALNPRAGKARRLLAEDREAFATLTVLVNTVPGMARAVHDRYSPSLTADPVVRSIAQELDRAAHDLLLLLHSEPSEPISPEPPALTAPLVVARPDEHNWILVGALLEDLRRIRMEIVGATE